MNYTLENESIILTIDLKGAELKSLVRKSDHQEYMWNGDEAFWGRTSPILFPVVGRFFKDHYIHEGKTYSISQHGFARDREFTLVEKSEDEIVMRLDSDDASRAVYPFDYALEIGYKVNKSEVIVSWKVVNTGESVMYFSIGGHPGFLCPLNADEKQEEYSVKFSPASDCLESRLLEGGYASQQIEEYVLEEGGILPLTDGIFDGDALVIEGNQAQQVSLLKPDGTEYLSVSFDAPLFGIWSPPKKHAPFVCIEPWYGRCDPVGYEGELKDREWGNFLESGAVFETSYKISIK